MAADPTILQGILNTSSGDTTIQVRDVADTILELRPSSSPLTVITSKLSKREVTNIKFEEYESEPIPEVLTLRAAVADGAATGFVFDHPEYLVAGATIYVPATDEFALVGSAPTTGTTTMVRGTKAKAIPAGSLVYILGVAREQATTVGTARKVQESNGFNYIQHFEQPVSLGLEFANTKVYGKVNNRTVERARKAVQILRDIEMAFLIGQKWLTTTGGNVVSASGGLKEWIVSNMHDLGAKAITENAFDSGLMTDFEYGSDSKWFFCSPAFAQRISSWGKQRLITNSGLKQQYGFDVSDYFVNGATLHIVRHPLMKGKTVNDVTGLGGMGFVVDINYLTYCYLQNTGTTKGGDVKFYPDLQPANANYVLDSWEGWVGLERRMEKAFGIWYNLGG
jgi:hypothetical protein